jgi:hypothetical protein
MAKIDEIEKCNETNGEVFGGQNKAHQIFIF